MVAPIPVPSSPEPTRNMVPPAAAAPLPTTCRPVQNFTDCFSGGGGLLGVCPELTAGAEPVGPDADGDADCDDAVGSVGPPSLARYAGASGTGSAVAVTVTLVPFGSIVMGTPADGSTVPGGTAVEQYSTVLDALYWHPYPGPLPSRPLGSMPFAGSPLT